MKKLLPFLILLGVIAWVGVTLLPPKNTTSFDLVGFGRLPVLMNGRIKPLDTVARSTLLQIQSRQEVRITGVKDPVVGSPTEWLLDVMFRPEKADTYETFVVEHLEHPDVVALIGQTPESLKINYNNPILSTLALADMVPKTRRRFSFKELLPHLKEIEDQARMASQVEEKLRTPFQNAVAHLYASLHAYAALRHAAVSPNSTDFVRDLMTFQDKLQDSIAAFRAKQAGQPHDEALVTNLMEMGERFDAMSRMSTVRLIPPSKAETDDTAWKSAGTALLETFQSGQVDSSALAYAGFAHAWRGQKPEEFNTLLGLYQKAIAPRFAQRMEKVGTETRFNAAAPFYTATVLYALAFFMAVLSWLLWPDVLRRGAFGVVAIAWLLSTAGILTRMWLEGRPPVTNLYSSALFIGWGAVGLCLVLEWLYKNSVPSVAAGVIGFCTLIIAHHLSLSGDTLEMMRAVLDTNLWLATHVVIVVTGYAATFLAGFLAIIYVLLGLFTPLLRRPFDRRAATALGAASTMVGGAYAGALIAADAQPAGKKGETAADTINRMVYGIVCFATLASFTGTVLGGIWADQSWGRFWGWDPKENGALLIVLWNAVFLHVRWGGMLKARGLMNMAIFGNVMTSWSWFGTNMLGVGLHSYGFTDSAFVVLISVCAAHVALIALSGFTPLAKWRSFRAPKADLPAEKLEPIPAK